MTRPSSKIQTLTTLKRNLEPKVQHQVQNIAELWRRKQVDHHEGVRNNSRHLQYPLVSHFRACSPQALQTPLEEVRPRSLSFALAALFLQGRCFFRSLGRPTPVPSLTSLPHSPHPLTSLTHLSASPVQSRRLSPSLLRAAPPMLAPGILRHDSVDGFPDHIALGKPDMPPLSLLRAKVHYAGRSQPEGRADGRRPIFVRSMDRPWT